MNLPFQTVNAALALTLVSCGADHPQNEQGQRIPCFNIYSREKLIELGYRGWKIEEAAKAAHAKGIPGVIIYQFVHDDVCREIIDAWNKQSADIQEAMIGAENEKPFSVPSRVLPDLGPAEAARVCCQLLKNRRVFFNLWKQTRPLYSVHGQIKERSDATGASISGSFKAISVDASPALHERIGI